MVLHAELEVGERDGDARGDHHQNQEHLNDKKKKKSHRGKRMAWS